MGYYITIQQHDTTHTNILHYLVSMRRSTVCTGPVHRVRGTLKCVVRYGEVQCEVRIFRPSLA